VRIDGNSPIPVYIQIEQLIERLILTRELSAHELVPGVSVLARQLKVAPLTVQKAYRRLQERGLIYSIAGKGSFVADASDQEFVGILIHNQYLLEAAQAPTPAILIQAICDQLAAMRMRVRILTDTYPRFRAAAPISPDVISTIEHGRPVGMVLMGHYGSDELFKLAKSRSFPLIGVGVTSPNAEIHANFDVRVNYDYEVALKKSLSYLLERGITEPAILWLDEDNSPAERLDYLKFIEQTIVDCGLKPNRDWIIGVHQTTDWAGYHAFNHLCSLPRRPQGLVVLDDVIGRGVHMGVLARQMRVPEDLVIVVQINEDSPIVFPQQWQQCGYNLAELARIIVDTLERARTPGAKKTPSEIKCAPRWRSATARSPWNNSNVSIRTDGQHRPLFRSGRQVLETTT
jgi:DNA-binding transcriptional regulator YhcF (GntR family)